MSRKKNPKARATRSHRPQTLIDSKRQRSRASGDPYRTSNSRNGPVRTYVDPSIIKKD